MNVQFDWLMRPVAAAIGSGSVTSLVLALAREALRVDPAVYTGVPEVCSVLSSLDKDWQLDHFSLALGIFIGICLLPLVDLALVLRLYWVRWVRQSLVLQPGRPLYRVLG